MSDNASKGLIREKRMETNIDIKESPLAVVFLSVLAI